MKSPMISITREHQENNITPRLHSGQVNHRINLS